ncbi:MAG: hypothetical protein PHT24_05175, partial [Endomicrobiaceae bacterium]|nr:hypothetical protein [Endomicrobiaceae bacterium]
VQYSSDGSRIDSIKINTEFNEKGDPIAGYNTVYSDKYGFEVSGTYRAVGQVKMSEIVNDSVVEQFEFYRSQRLGLKDGTTIYDVMDRDVDEDTELVRVINTPRILTGDGRYTQLEGDPIYVYVKQDGFIKSKELIKQYPNGEVTVSLWNLTQGTGQIRIIDTDGSVSIRDVALGIQPGYFVIKPSSERGELVVYQDRATDERFNGEDCFEYEVFYHELKRNSIYTTSGKLVGERYLRVVSQVMAGILGTAVMPTERVTLTDGRTVVAGLETVYYDPTNMSFDKAVNSMLILTEDQMNTVLKKGWQTDTELWDLLKIRQIGTDAATGKPVYELEDKSGYEYTFSTVAQSDEDGINFNFWAGIGDIFKSVFNIGKQEQVIKVVTTDSEGLDLSVKNQIAKIYKNGEQINQYSVGLFESWIKRSVPSIMWLFGIFLSIGAVTALTGLFAGRNERKRIAKKSAKNLPDEDLSGTDEEKIIAQFTGDFVEGNVSDMGVLLYALTGIDYNFGNRALLDDQKATLGSQLKEIETQLKGKVKPEEKIKLKADKEAAEKELDSVNKEIERLDKQEKGSEADNIKSREEAVKEALAQLIRNNNIHTPEELRAIVTGEISKSLPKYVENWLKENKELENWFNSSTYRGDVARLISDNKYKTLLQIQEFIVKGYINSIPNFGDIHDSKDKSGKFAKEELGSKIVRQLAIGRSISDIIRIELGNYINDLWIEPIMGKSEVITDLSLKDLFIWYKIQEETHVFANNNSSLKFYLGYTIFKGIRNNDSRFIKDGAINFENFVNKEIIRWSMVLININNEKNNPILKAMMTLAAQKKVPLKDQVLIDEIEDYFRTPEFIDWYENGIADENNGKKGRDLVDEYILEQELKIGLLNNTPADIATILQMDLNNLKDVAEINEKIIKKLFRPDVLNGLDLNNNEQFRNKIIQILKDLKEAIGTNQTAVEVYQINEKKHYNVFDKEKRMTKTYHDLAGGFAGFKGLISLIDNYKWIFAPIIAISTVTMAGMLLTSGIAVGAVIGAVAGVLAFYVGLIIAVKFIKNKLAKESMGETDKQWKPINPEDTQLVKDRLNSASNIKTKKRSAVTTTIILAVKAGWNLLVWSWIGVPLMTLFTASWPALTVGAISFAPVLGVLALAAVVLFFLVDIFGFFYIWEAALGWVIAAKNQVSNIHNWKGLTKTRKVVVNGAETELSTFDAGKERFKEYLLPKYVTGNDGFKRLMTEEEKEVAWMRHWNLIVEQWAQDKKITPEERANLRYEFDADPDNYLKVSNIRHTPEYSKPVENKEIQERVCHYFSTLFMDLENTPEWEKMRIFSVVTPCYNEVVMYAWADKDDGDLEGIFKRNKNGFTLLNEQIRIYPDEWEAFIKLLAEEKNPDGSAKYSKEDLNELTKLLDPQNRGKIPNITNPDLQLEIRLWVSYRYQPLARTVRGVMNYRQTYEFYARVNYPTKESLGENTAENYEKVIEDKIDEKFEYIVGLQIFGNQSKDTANAADKQKALDAVKLLEIYPKLKIAYLDGPRAVLLRNRDVTVEGTRIIISPDVEYIQLEGGWMFAQGKPINQNSLMKFVRGETVQFMDMNQDMDLEETFKQPGLITRFDRNLRLAMLGFPERIYTDKSSPTGTAHAFADRVFNTITQRVLHWHGVRFHYGHPDFLNVADVRNLGLIMPTNVNEDIQGAYKAKLFGQEIENNETMRAAKGREGVYVGLLGINDKFVSGAWQQAMTRYMYRMNKSGAIGYAKQFMHFMGALGYYIKKIFIPFILAANSLVILTLGISFYVSFPSVLTFGILSVVFSQAITIPGLVQMIKERGLIKGTAYFFKIWPTLMAAYGSLLLTAFSRSTIVKTLKGFGDYVATGRLFGRNTRPIITNQIVEDAKVGSTFSLSQRSITLTVVLNVLNIIGFLLWANPGMWWSIFVILMPIMSILTPALFNPASTPVQTKVKDWDLKNKEDSAAISKSHKFFKTAVPFLTTLIAIGVIFINPALTLTAFIGWFAVYFNIPGFLLFKIPGLKDKFEKFYNYKTKSGKIRGEKFIWAFFGMVIFGKTSVVEKANGKEAIKNLSYRQSFNTWFSMFILKPMLLAISAVVFWASSAAYLVKKNIFKKDPNSYKFGFGLVRHNDLKPTATIVKTTLVLAGFAMSMFGPLGMVIGVGLIALVFIFTITTKIGENIADRKMNGKWYFGKFFVDFFTDRNILHEGSVIAIISLILLPALLILMPGIIYGYKKHNRESRELFESIKNMPADANEAKEEKTRIQRILAISSNEELVAAYNEYLSAGEIDAGKLKKEISSLSKDEAFKTQYEQLMKLIENISNKSKDSLTFEAFLEYSKFLSAYKPVKEEKANKDKKAAEEKAKAEEEAAKATPIPETPAISEKTVAVESKADTKPADVKALEEAIEAYDKSAKGKEDNLRLQEAMSKVAVVST